MSKEKNTNITEVSIRDWSSKIRAAFNETAKLSIYEKILTDDVFKKENMETYDIDTKIVLWMLALESKKMKQENQFRVRDLGKEILGSFQSASKREKL